MNLFYIIEALKSLNRSKFSSLIITLSLCIAITLITSSVYLIMLSSKIESKLKRSIEVNVFLHDSLSSGSLAKLTNDIGGIDNVSFVKLISKEEAAKNFIRETGEDFNQILLSNPLPNSFKVRFTNDINDANLEMVLAEIRTFQGIEEIVYDYNYILTIVKAIDSAKILIYLLSFTFTLISLFLIYSNNRFYINLRIEHFNTMKLVGAKLSTIQLPLMLRGIILGLAASLICGFLGTLFLVTLNKINFSIRFINNYYLFNFIVLLLGLLLGLIGSSISAKKVSLNINFKPGIKK